MASFASWFGRGKRRPAAPAAAVRVRGRFDAAESGDDRRHWANADAFAADAALSPVVRNTIRNRARYERANNSYLAGIVETRSNDLIGTGPRLQLTTGNPDADRAIERLVFDWGWQIDLPGKLRTLFDAKQVDGEAFAMFVTNDRLPGVQLDVRLVEAEMIATPTGLTPQTVTPEGSVVDGLEFDSVGNVIAYHVLNFHPGANFRVSSLDFRRVDASQVVHWFRAQRPAQHRGVSEVAPALRLFGQLRRYTEAVCAAAETAADFAGFLRTNSPAAEVDELEAFQEMPIEKRSLVTLPDGWTFEQLRAEQPTSTYAMFKREIVGEISRCLQIPYNVAALDSSSYNYASGRMDHQIYGLTVRVSRDELERVFLDRMLSAWVAEAAPAGLLPEDTPPFPEWNWAWQWDGREHVDPSKEASAARDRLETLTTTYAAEYAKQGKSWDVEFRQIAAERQLMRDLGLEVAARPMPDPLSADDPSDDNTPADQTDAATATHAT
jgi:lambda family phage portal protein